uniref:AccB n=1 Tax=Pleurastrosarcina brevispinosa TaxID=163096 RepID=A0A097KN93_9CHLO|nr:AccB [Chlorosarcina brevispinosa]
MKEMVAFFLTKNESIFVLIKKSEIGLSNKNKSYKQKDKTYYRFRVKDKQNILRLIHLFNLSILLDKVFKRFENWVFKTNQLWNLNIVVKQNRPEISLTNSWLTGFREALVKQSFTYGWFLCFFSKK